MFPGSVACETGLAWAVIINNKNVIVEPGVYHVLGIGDMFLWGDKQKKFNKNWLSQVYTMFSGSVVCSFGKTNKILSLLPSNSISGSTTMFLVISDLITSLSSFYVFGSCSL